MTLGERIVKKILEDKWSRERKVTQAWKNQKFKEGQTFKYVMDMKTGKKLSRIKYNENNPCGDCSTTKGNYHWLSCDQEKDPFNNSQLLILLLKKERKYVK